MTKTGAVRVNGRWVSFQYVKNGAQEVPSPVWEDPFGVGLRSFVAITLGEAHTIIRKALTHRKVSI